jgi:signal transduction histidine kinase
MARQRKLRLVDRNLQVGLTGSFIAIAAVGAVLQAVLLSRSIDALLASGDAETLRIEVPALLMRNLLVTVPVVAASMWVFGILITHRVAGPLYRLERHLEALASGEPSEDCTLRVDDELQGLCEKLNVAVERLRSRGAAQTTVREPRDAA